jgi:hypothetical protein
MGSTGTARRGTAWRSVAQLPKEVERCGGGWTDAERRTTGGSGGDGGRAGDEDEETKRAGGGTPEEAGGAGRRWWQGGPGTRCAGPNLALVWLGDTGGGVRHGGGGRGTGAGIRRGGGGGGHTSEADVEATATLVQRRDGGRDREWRSGKERSRYIG